MKINLFYAFIVCFFTQFTVYGQVSPGGVGRTNLRVWLKADAGTNTTVGGADVNDWQDQSDYNNDAVRSTAVSVDIGSGDVFGNDPSYVENVLNFNPGIDFDDVDRETLEIASGNIFSTASVPDINMFVITKVDEIKPGTMFFNFPHDQNDRFGIHLPWDDNNLYWDYGDIDGGNGRLNFGLGQTVVESRIWSFRSSATKGIQDARRDGTQIVTTGALETFGRGTSFGILMGAHSTHDFGWTPQEFIDATISELIIFEGTLTDAQRERLETYLAIKYGVTMGHDYFTVAYDGTNAASTTLYDISNGYGNDIAGIGRDDIQGLNQTTSKSINDDASMTVTGATSLDDNDYLVWGNNGNTGSSADLPAGYDERLNRIWYFEEVGEVGTVTIRFDLKQLGKRSRNPDDYALLINNASPIFAGVTPFTNGVNIVDDVITFTNVSIADGDYLSLAVSSVGAPGAISANMLLWVSPESVVTDAEDSDVDQWTDQSGFSNNLESMLFDRPVLETSAQVNGNNYLVFSGDNMGQATLNATSNANSFITVVRGSTNGVDLFEVDNNTNPRLEINGGVYRVNGGAFTSTTGTGDWHIVELINNNSNNHQIFVNGDLESTNTGFVTIAASDDYNFFTDYTGDVAEAVYYSNSLNDSERRQVETYLAVKYGITLDISSQDYLNGSGATILDRTAFSSYSSIISGIGRANADMGVDAQGLIQQESKNVNTNAIITIGNPTDLTDGEYLFWGSNNETALASLTESASSILGVSMTLDRKWRVTETGETGTVDISFNLNGVNAVSGRALAQYTLVVDDNEDMSSPITNIKPTYVTGNVITFSGINLDEGNYVVLGSNVDSAPAGVSTNLNLWLRAGTGVENSFGVPATDGQTVEYWRDQSANSNDAVETINFRKPRFNTSVINDNPVVTFANLDLSLQGSITTTTAGLTFFIVGTHNDAANSTDAFFEFRNNAVADQDGRNWFEDNRYASTTTYTSNIQKNSSGLWSIDHPSGRVANIYENGIAFQLSNATNYSVSPAGTYDYVLGDDDTGGNELNGNIAELVAYEGTLSVSDRQKIESYFGVKYGITLGHNYYSSTYNGSNAASTTIYDVSTYSNDIAGIGRDDSELLSQTQSKSENADAILTMGTPSDLGDAEYLIWGNDNGALSETTVNVPSGITDMLTRKWRVEETGDVGAVTVTFDVSSIGGIGTVAEDFALITDTDADFTSGTVITNASSFASNIVTFNSVDLNDGAFFTLATGVSSALTEISSAVGDYEVSTGCPTLNGASFVMLRDASGRIVAEVNPNGNDLGETCWGVRIRTSGDNVVDVSNEDYFIDRNFYITPTNAPTSPVTVRLYFLNDEVSDIRTQLAADGRSNGADWDEYYRDFFRVTKRDGSSLDLTGVTMSLDVFTPTITSHGSTGIAAEIDVNSFSEFYAGTDSDDPSAPLPINLVSFNAESEGYQVLLTWETASETNNDFFTIEKSSDGVGFTELGKVSGAGNSSELLSYQYIDQYPFGGKSYYRLKQTDFDGEYSYSEVVVVQNMLDLSLNIYPNPIHDKATVQFNQKIELSSVDVSVVDMTGRLIQSSISKINDSIIDIDLSSVVPGIYYATIIANGYEKEIKLIKQ